MASEKEQSASSTPPHSATTTVKNEDEEDEQKETRRITHVRQVFVRNLPFRVRWQEVKDLFRKAGHVLRADVALRADNRSKGHGTVLFATVEDAQHAIDMLHGYKWRSRVLEVREDRDFVETEVQTEKTSLEGHQGRQLFVGNLPFHCQWQDVKDLFRKAGNIQRADVVLGPDGRSRGFGTVLYATAEDATNAIEKYNGYEFHGRVLRVQLDKYVSAPQNPRPDSGATRTESPFTYPKPSPFPSTPLEPFVQTTSPQTPFTLSEDSRLLSGFHGFPHISQDHGMRNDMSTLMPATAFTGDYLAEMPRPFASNYPWSLPEPMAYLSPYSTSTSASTGIFPNNHIPADMNHGMVTAAFDTAAVHAVEPYPYLQQPLPYQHYALDHHQGTELADALHRMSLADRSAGLALSAQPTDRHQANTSLSPSSSSTTTSFLGSSTLGGNGVWGSFNGFKY